MSVSVTPNWPPRDRAKIIPKEDYVALRELAQSKGISLIGVKQFDGAVPVVREMIEALSALKDEFPAVSDARHKLELEMSIRLGAADYAETSRRTIKLNANAFRDVQLLATEYQKDVAAGWFVEGTTWRDILRHEFGHVVANVYGLAPLKIAREITGQGNSQTLKFLETALSRYAGTEPSGREIIAEVFADMSTPTPSEFSRKFYAKILALTR